MQKKQFNFSSFEGYKGTTPVQFYSTRKRENPLTKVFNEYIKSGALQTQKELAQKDSTLKKIVKAQQTAAFTFGGVFTYRDTSNVTSLSGLICLDYDKKDNAEIDFKALPTFLSENPYILGFFETFSGGVKILCHYEHNLEDVSLPEIYATAAKAASVYFEVMYGLKADPTSYNVAQNQLVSYDPNAVLNDSSEVLPFSITQSDYENFKAQAPAPTPNNDSEPTEISDFEGVFEAIDYAVSLCEENNTDIFEDFQSIRNVGFGLKNVFGHSGFSLFERLCTIPAANGNHDTCRNYLDFWSSIKERKSGKKIGIGTVVKAFKDSGIAISLPTSSLLPKIQEKEVKKIYQLHEQHLGNDLGFVEAFFSEFRAFLADPTKTVFPLIATTGTGKTTFFLRNLEKFVPKDGRIYAFFPRLTNTKDVLERCKKLGLKAFVISSEFVKGENTENAGRYDKKNFEENGVSFQTADVVICTYQSFSQVQNAITVKDLLVFDEIHCITETPYLALQKAFKVNKCLTITATPNKNFHTILGENLATPFEVVPKNPQKSTFCFSDFSDLAVIANYLKKKETGRYLVQVDFRANAEMLAKLLDNACVLSSKNKEEWYAQLIENQTFPPHKYVICTSVVSAGIDSFDTDFSETIFVQSGIGKHNHTCSNMVQFANRLRNGKLPITLFRKNPAMPAVLPFAHHFQKLKEIAQIFASETNLGLKHLHNFDSEVIEYGFGKIANLVSYCSKARRYEPNELAILQYFDDTIYARKSNESLAKEIEEYGYETVPFAGVLGKNSELSEKLSELRSEKELAINAKIEADHAVLMECENFQECEELAKPKYENGKKTPPNEAAKRVLRIEKILRATNAQKDEEGRTIVLNAFEDAKKLVLENQSRRQFGELEKRVRIEYLFRTKVPNPKEKVLQNLIRTFVSNYNAFASNCINENITFNFRAFKDEIESIFSNSIRSEYRLKISLFGNPFEILACLNGFEKAKKNGKVIFTPIVIEDRTN